MVIPSPAQQNAIALPTAAMVAQLTTRPQIVATQGQSIVGDGYSAVYYWDSASTATADGINTIQCKSGTAGRYRALFAEQPFLPGVVTDGETSSIAALQLAVNNAISSNKARVPAPAKIIKITDTLQMGYGINLSSLVLEGQGAAYNGELDFCGTVIDATGLTDRPAINIQGGRISKIKGLSIIGPNNAYLSAASPMATFSKPSWDDTVWANWVDPALLIANPNADSRYAPVAGITIDGYSGAQPSPHYPAITYPMQTTLNVPSNLAVGLANATASLGGSSAPNNYLGFDANSIGLYGGGEGIWKGGSRIGTYGPTFSASDTIDIETDTLAHIVRFRVRGGAWSPDIDISGMGTVYQAFSLYTGHDTALSACSLVTSPYPPTAGFTVVGGEWNTSDVAVDVVVSADGLSATSGGANGYYNGRGNTIVAGKKTFALWFNLASYGQYNKLPSSIVTLEDVHIYGFVAGIVSQPGNFDQNGDFINIIGGSINNCRYGLSIGNSQSRNVTITGHQMNGVAQCLVNNVHGTQRGQFGGTITGLSLAQCGEVFNMNSSFSGPITFNNLYAENLFKLGELSAGDVMPYLFNNAQINFNSYINRGIPPAYYTGGSAPIFKGGRIIGFPDVAVFSTSIPGSFEQTLVQANNTPADLAHYLGSNATCGGLVINWIDQASQIDVRNPRYERWNMDTGAGGDRGTQHPHAYSSRSDPASAYATVLAPKSYVPSSTYGVPSYGGYAAIAKNVGGLSSTQSGLTLTMTFSTYTPYQFAITGPLPGDIIVDQDTGTTFIATAKASQVVTATQLNNYKYNGSTYSNFSPINLATGNWVIYTGRYYMGTEPMVGVASSGSSVIAITDAQGNNISATSGNPVANDWLAVNPYLDQFADQTGAQISSIDGSGNYTFSGTNITKYAFSNKLLPHWIRWTG